MLLAESWARLDAPGAFAYVSGWSDPNKRLHGIVAVSYAWGRRDPTAARRALDEIRDPNVLEEAIPALARGWVRSGVPGVSDFVAGLPKGQFRQLVTIALIGEIIKRDGRAAVANWAESLPNDSPAQFKKTAFRKVAGLMAHKDPPATAAWVERHAGWSYAEGTTKIVAMRWADVDPPASLTWLSTRPPGPERETAVWAAASRWLERDPPAAEEWFGQHADEAWLNPGQDALARRLASTAPARAAALGVQIQDAERRGKCLAFILGHWLDQDPEDARAWLETAALAEEDRRTVLEASEARHRSGTPPGES